MPRPNANTNKLRALGHAARRVKLDSSFDLERQSEPVFDDSGEVTKTAIEVHYKEPPAYGPEIERRTRSQQVTDNLQALPLWAKTIIAVVSIVGPIVLAIIQAWKG